MGFRPMTTRTRRITRFGTLDQQPMRKGVMKVARNLEHPAGVPHRNRSAHGRIRLANHTAP